MARRTSRAACRIHAAACLTILYYSCNLTVTSLKFHRSGSVARSYELPKPSAILFLASGVDGLETLHLSTPTRTYVPTLHSFHLPATYMHLPALDYFTYTHLPAHAARSLCFRTTTEQRRRGPSPSSPTAMGTPSLISGATYLHLPAHARNVVMLWNITLGAVWSLINISCLYS